ncbi:helix-turn-helix domain-containing protein [Streptomyces sp. NPDC050546]|uniref:helix-turn-helix domain-containing protein n=1 Tax=Streptomyces sp. NPDC050546 TaxID=3365628 RepID=UPI00379055AB
MLIRTAQLTNKEVSSRIGCSSSYLSRILSGERVPTWALTRKFAQTCGADPEVPRTSGNPRSSARRTASPPSRRTSPLCPPPTGSAPPCTPSTCTPADSPPAT